MLKKLQWLLLIMLLTISGKAFAEADRYEDTIEVFRNAGESAEFFENSYAFAVYPSVGRAGIGIGGARGSGRVFIGDQFVGDTVMSQLTVGLQLGGVSYSMIVFLQDKRAFDEFTSGRFSFSGQANATAITASASARATTTGSSAGASGGQNDAATVGSYSGGMAIFTVAKGGLMYEASLGGARFSFTPVEGGTGEE
jgi:lipid-binding SYLF domain-containing protein